MEKLSRLFVSLLMLGILSGCMDGNSVSSNLDSSNPQPTSSITTPPPESTSAPEAAETSTAEGESTNVVPYIFVEREFVAREGQTFQINPVINDEDEQTLTLRIANKPGWLVFNDQTGHLSGTPDSASVGTYENIVIFVSDGVTEIASQSFSIVVNSTSATVSWNPPMVRADNSPLPLSELAGYRVYAGTHPDRLTLAMDVNAAVTQHKFTNLAPATYFYAVAAYNHHGDEGALSDVVSKEIR